MRKTHLSSFATPLVATIFILCAAGASLAVTTTFKVQVPDRGNGKPQIKRVKVLLELAGDPTGSTVSVNGGVAGGFGCLLQDAANNDQFTFKRISGTNKVVLELLDNTRFLNPTNMCNATAAPHFFDVTLESPVAVTGYRIASYTVPILEVPPPLVPLAIECTQAKRRVNTSPAFFDVPLPPGEDKGRLPLDVILVLDKSGSMGWKVPGFDAIRWNVLKDSVDQFIAIWKTEGFNAFEATGGVDLADDRLGLAFFDSNSTPPENGANVDFIERAASGIDWDTQIMGTEINPDPKTIRGKNPGGSTAMGKGLKKGILSWEAENSAVACVDGTAPAIGNSSDATVVLMTDGEQNVAPFIVDDAGEMKLDFGSGNTRLRDRGIPILSIALRPPGDPTATLLDKVSTQTAGAPLPQGDFDAAGIAMAFAQGLVESLKGNTLSVLSQQKNSLPAQAMVSSQTPVFLDGSVRRAVFVLGWEGDRNVNALDLQIIKPGGPPSPTTGIIPVAPVVRYDGKFWTVQAVDIPQTGPTGDWNVRVIRKGQSITQDATPYHLSAYAYEERLSYRINFPPRQPGTGEPIVLNVEVGYDGKPLAGLGDALKVRIARPGEGFGTLMFNNKVSGDVLGTELPGAQGDSTTELQRKIEHLSKTTDLLKQVKPTPLPNVFTLRDSGSAADGDARAGDGVYSASFSDTTKPGLYRFNVALEWNDPRTGIIRRLENVERHVKVTPDASASVVEMAVDRTTGDYLVRVVPKDKFGNFYGPGLQHLIDVKANGRKASVPADPQQTGEYVVRLSLIDPTQNPDSEVTVTVDGKVIETGKPGGGTNPGVEVIPADASDKRWGLSLHAGANFPHSDFGNFFKTGFSFNADLEYRVSNRVSLEALYGYHRFRFVFFSGHLNLHLLSGNVKFYGGGTTVKPFINGGGGLYHFDGGGGGGDTRGGANIGGGLQFNLTPTFALEGAYNFHSVFTPGSNVNFSTLQGGVRFRF
jgi:hypothetical protein